MFHLQFCQENLLRTRSFVIAQVVTSHYCLGLPKVLFQNVSQALFVLRLCKPKLSNQAFTLVKILMWLSDFCFEELNGSEEELESGQIVCQFDSISQIQTLPSISFRLSESGPVLELPLASLIGEVVEHAPGSQHLFEATLCIIYSDQFSHHQDDKIIFGLLALENFYFAVDTLHYRVGFYQVSNSSCM
jgi:hypothetical protein